MEQESRQPESSTGFTFFSFVWRFLIALVLVLTTYNPTDYSLFGWIGAAFTNDSLGPAHLFVCVLFMIGWTIFLVATFRSLGPLGLTLGAAFFGTLIWMLSDLGILTTASFSTITWIALVCLAGLLAIGLSWSHVWRRMTGQLVVDHVEES
jgi:hypothetical protein